jgi:hypothetical protein
MRHPIVYRWVYTAQEVAAFTLRNVKATEVWNIERGVLFNKAFW